jgi:hypothetical protein
MTKVNTLSRLALVLSLAALGGASLEAAEIAGSEERANSVRIVNNFGDMVRVYAEDTTGRLHKLGHVASGKLAEFEVPTELVAAGFRIRVIPAQPAWAIQQTDYAVKTNPLTLTPDGDVTLWLEPDLSKSVLQVDRG